MAIRFRYGENRSAFAGLLPDYNVAKIYFIKYNQKEKHSDGVLFFLVQLYPSAAGSICFTSDIRCASGIGFASFLGGYNITAPKVQYHFCEAKISLCA